MTQATIRPLRQGAARADARVCARSAPLFTADEVWSRTNADRRSAGETDDQDSILEPGFWMATVVAFLPTVAGCFYLFLSQG
ncbi:MULTISPECIES: hypothetical protein [unclassified Bradyrhizobium]|jgi:hypothetical protein|uniref:hypothetical protein n=1 Tax=unclassified Bradyrhizobium TaxID=2631580 RepID=UPI002304206F|nr:hypothetical protein [Bradyrhizobium sp. CCBAU 25338]MDA9532099.1 hypothetical protein [Bradyrhizobium sp. CCBAU 25338]